MLSYIDLSDLIPDVAWLSYKDDFSILIPGVVRPLPLCIWALSPPAEVPGEPAAAAARAALVKKFVLTFLYHVQNQFLASSDIPDGVVDAVWGVAELIGWGDVFACIIEAADVDW